VIKLGLAAVLLAAGPWFEDVTARAGLTWRDVNGAPDQTALLDQNGQGIAVIDYDGDGLPDLFFPNGSTLVRLREGKPGGPWALFRNRGDGTFEDVTEQAGICGEGWATGAAAADADGDGFADLYVTAFGPGQFYRGDGDGTFTRVPGARGAEGDAHQWASSAAFGDVDRDGLLDLVVGHYVQFDPAHQPRAEEDGRPCTYRGVLTGCGPWRWKGDGPRLYRNVGTGFVDVTARAGLGVGSSARCFQVVLVDLDGDGDLDLYVGCDVMPNVVLENVGGTFRRNPSWGGEVNFEGKAESSMGLAVADVDGDGLPSVYVTNFAGQKSTLYLNRPGSPRFSDASVAARLDGHRAELGWGAAVADFDLDGVQDAFHVNGQIYPQVACLHDPADGYAQPPRLYQGLPPQPGDVPAFREVTASLTLYPFDIKRVQWCARGLALADFDHDGAPDLVVGLHNGAPRVLANRAEAPRERALTVELAGTRSPRQPLGARATLEVAGTRQVRFLVPHQGFQGSQESRLFFAWPRGATAGRLAVRWPSGRTTVEEVRGAGALRIVEVWQ